MPDTTQTLVASEQKQLATQVDSLLASRAYFIEKVLPILKPAQDYYEIKGRKSLAKGGAEKLASIFNLVASFTVDKDTMSLLPVTGMVAYVCDLKDREGNARGQGRGADVLGRNQNDPNKTIKMAQKRAYIDAIIRATGLSDIFTQDMEEMADPVYAPISHAAPVEAKRPYQPPIATPKASQTVNSASVDPSTEIQKREIKELIDELDPSIDALMADKKKGYEDFVRERTGFDLSKNGNYGMIIVALKRIKDSEIKVEDLPQDF